MDGSVTVMVHVSVDNKPGDFYDRPLSKKIEAYAKTSLDLVKDWRPFDKEFLFVSTFCTKKATCVDTYVVCFSLKLKIWDTNGNVC